MAEGLIEFVGRDYKTPLVDDQEALDMIEQQDQSGTPYDAILMNYFMPIMDGKQTISKIKALEDNAHLKSKTPSIILMSTDAVTDSRAETFLSKAITSSSFLDALSEVGNPLSLVRSKK